MDLATVRKKATKVLRNAHHLPSSEFRVCRCCNPFSMIVSFSEGEEAKLCIRCLANLRYEMLASYLRDNVSDLNRMTVLELDHRSPLRNMLADAKIYIRSYYSATVECGSVREDGARCEDITSSPYRLTA